MVNATRLYIHLHLYKKVFNLLNGQVELNIGSKCCAICAGFISVNPTIYVFLCVSGPEARVLLLPGSLLPWGLALHASGLLGCQLCPLSCG